MNRENMDKFIIISLSDNLIVTIFGARYQENVACTVKFKLIFFRNNNGSGDPNIKDLSL